MKKLIPILLCLAAFAAPHAGAQSAIDDFADSLSGSHKLVFIDGRPVPEEHAAYVDSVRRVISSFYYDQFRHFQDPEAPYFLFMSKDARLSMGIGGAVRMRGYYDWGGAIPASGFAPYLIPMDPAPEKMRKLGTTPAGTCLFFRVIGRNKTLGTYQLYIEANFNGYSSRDFHLKKAYAIINDFTVGYAPSTFSDPAAIAPTVDAQGPNNKISPTRVLVRYMPVIRDRWYLAVSAETPEQSITADGKNTSEVDVWMPEFGAFVQYEWARGQHVRLSGILRTLSYRDLIAGKNHSRSGWGVQLSTVFHPAYALTVYGTANYGHGYQSLGGDMMIGSYDLLPVEDKPGRLYAPASFGWSLGLQYNIRPNLFVTLVGSQTRYQPKYHVDPSEYKTGFFAAANIFWYLTPRMSVGAEYAWGQRRNFSGDHRHAQRIGAMCQFSF